MLPDFSQVLTLILPALSLAILAVTVSAGVSQNYPNPDGSMADANRDFMGVGWANLVGGFFQGLPASGSLSRTAVSVSSGARSRWAAIFAGLILALLLLTIAGLAEFIPEAGLAGLLIFVGLEAINQQRVGRAWNTHAYGRVGMVTTFVLTLLVPLQNAIYLGVLVSLLLYVYSASVKVRVTELVPLGDGRFEEGEAPAELPSNKATVVRVYGAPFFAAIETIAKQMPSHENTENGVLILTGRGRETAINTFFTWLQRYAQEMRASGNRLMLAEIEPHVPQQLENTGVIETLGRENVFEAQSILGASIDQAVAAADAWIAAQQAADSGESEAGTEDKI